MTSIGSNKENLMHLIAALAALLAFAPQDSDADVKRRIMDKVRERLAEEKKRIMEKMAGVIDEELSGKPRAKDSAPGKKDPRLVPLERELQKLEDKRDDLMRDIRAIKRETEDAKIIQQARSNPPTSNEEYKQDFDEAFAQHQEKRYDQSIEGFKRLTYAFKDHEDRDVVRQAAAIPAYNVACAYALKGNKEQAIDWLEMSIKMGYNDFDHIRTDSDFDSIRKERRYLRLLADR
jgi:tetratricopeptide (TPR) repeat protein